jgi:hypothetical protein
VEIQASCAFNKQLPVLPFIVTNSRIEVVRPININEIYVCIRKPCGVLTNDVQLSGEILAKLGNIPSLTPWNLVMPSSIRNPNLSGGALMSCVSISALMLADIKIGSTIAKENILILRMIAICSVTTSSNNRRAPRCNQSAP